jgi:hypothetical protein
LVEAIPNTMVDPTTADVILTNTHQAKVSRRKSFVVNEINVLFQQGMEWDHVQLANDFVELVDNNQENLMIPEVCTLSSFLTSFGNFKC